MVSTSITDTMMNSAFKQFGQQILFCECVQVFNPFHLLVELVNLLRISLISLSRSHRLVFHIDLH